MAPPNRYQIGDAVHLSGTFTTADTLGTIFAEQNDLWVQNPSGFTLGDVLLVRGAAAVDGDLTASVLLITGSKLTLSTAAGATVYKTPVGKLLSPAAVTLRVRKPDGTSVGVSVAALSTGRYQGTFHCTTMGEHFYRFESANEAAEEQMFVVDEEQVASA